MPGPIKYVGGKSRLAKIIIERIPAHVTYVEPFCGGAKVFFQKQRSKVEILNDLDSQLVNFYRVCQSHHEELIRSISMMPVSRELFSDFRANKQSGLTDIQRAARFLYLQKLCYAGQVTGKGFFVPLDTKHDLHYDLISKALSEAHSRLAGVQIEHLPYSEIIRRYDRPATFFYLDPPYYDFHFYNHNFEHDDFVQLAKTVKSIKGKFLLSLNDHAEVRKLFASFTIKIVKLAYSLNRAGGESSQELLISNFAQ